MASEKAVLAKPQRFGANPHYYDYIHHFSLHPDEEGENVGTIELCDGGGQAINFMAKGRYEWIENDDRGKLVVTELVDNHFFRKTHPKYPDFEVEFTVVRETTYLEEGRVWNVSDPLKIQYLVYETKYVFDVDPLNAGMSSRRENFLKFMLEGNERELSRRTYYKDPERVSRADLIEQGTKFEKSGYYHHEYRVGKAGRAGDAWNRAVGGVREIDQTDGQMIEKMVAADENGTLICYYDLTGKTIGYFVMQQGGVVCNIKAMKCGPDYVHMYTEMIETVKRILLQYIRSEYSYPVHVPDGLKTKFVESGFIEKDDSLVIKHP